MIPCQTNENHVNLIIPFHNHENNAIHRITIEKHENHETFNYSTPE